MTEGQIVLEVVRTQYASVAIDSNVIDELLDMTLREYIECYLEDDFESEDVEVRVIG